MPRTTSDTEQAKPKRKSSSKSKASKGTGKKPASKTSGGRKTKSTSTTKRRSKTSATKAETKASPSKSSKVAEELSFFHTLAAEGQAEPDASSRSAEIAPEQFVGPLIPDALLGQRQAEAQARNSIPNTPKQPRPLRTTPQDPLAAKYDVRAISSLELTVLANELYQDGRIDRELFAMMSFQPEMHQQYDDVGAQGIGRPDPNRKRDALAEWEEILRRQEDFGNSGYFTDQTRRVIQALARLDQARQAAADQDT